MKLHSAVVGDGPRQAVFLHGLFGRGKNFNRIAKALEPEYSSLLLDLPNHGRSPWTERFDYLDMADTVADFLANDVTTPVDLIGHSMGGKTAMLLALRHPELVRKLVIEDISPVGQGQARDNSSEFTHLLASLATLDLASLESRSQADHLLADAIKNPGVRGFLLQNLRSSADGFYWEPNLNLLRNSLETIGGFPDTSGLTFSGPVLWIGGSDSDHIRPEHSATMRAIFPRTTKMMIKGSGHWVHSEKPEEFISVLRAFLLS